MDVSLGRGCIASADFQGRPWLHKKVTPWSREVGVAVKGKPSFKPSRKGSASSPKKRGRLLAFVCACLQHPPTHSNLKAFRGKTLISLVDSRYFQ